jgi:hypothetical protein
MNLFTAKKLGEVLAFTNMGLVIMSKGKNALERVLGKSSLEALTKMTQEQQTKIQELAEDNQVFEAVQEKSNKTEEKLKDMQNLYLQDKWEDESELLEWMGFFEGAALVHWKLVEGVAQQSSNTALTNIVNKGLTMHQALLFKISEAIRKVGSTKAMPA